jgi:serine/threonine-protein phosphatase 2A regulatory subunit B'
VYDKCTAAYFPEEEEAKTKLECITDRWTAIERLAATNQPTIAAK